MSFTYDINNLTPIHQVRLLIRDTDSTKVLLQNEEIQFFLDQNGADVHLAAADSLESLVGNAALLEKLEQIGDYKIDSRGMAKALMTAAERLRAQAEETPAFATSEMTVSIFAERDLVWNDILRTS